MSDSLYAKEIKCPICQNIFYTQRVKSSALRIEKRDSDFCVHYAGENPIYYGAYVCPLCGYAALESNFGDIELKAKKAIQESIVSRWVQRDFGKKRTINEAIETYKLTLLCGQVARQKKGTLGGICLRLAWLYRYNHEEREIDFLKHATECFEEAYRYESLPIGGMDDVSITYLLGELNRRLGKYEDAIYWFNKAIGNPGIKQKKSLGIQAREQWGLAREQFKQLKG